MIMNLDLAELDLNIQVRQNGVAISHGYWFDLIFEFY